jgi:pimeloyl-ACP methyl ester carboxylesterase
MSDLLDEVRRAQLAKPDADGRPAFDWTLTQSSLTDTVKLIAGPFDVLPVVFVPGIMGSNLKSKDTGKPVWRLDENAIGLPWNLIRNVATKGPGERQRVLHPDRCEVDPDGNVPKSPTGTVHSPGTYAKRGWGAVGEGSYHKYFLWLEEQLNPTERNPARWAEYYQDEATIGAAPEPGSEPKLFPNIKMGMQGQPFGAEKQPFAAVMTDDLIARGKFVMPVYAVGYNWLASNKLAGEALKKRIDEIITENNHGAYRCSQVVIVTHSMGGLVARACAQLSGMPDKIAGVVHGVMPAVGAAVAYRRCKVGMRDEDFGAGLVIGSNGREVTAVFAQAPGALQLLPSQTYAAEWLRVVNASGKVEQSLPVAASGGNDPYGSIYLERERWWGLVNEAWLSPKDGAPIRWDIFEKNVDEAQDFHAKLIAKYHPNTFAYYGADPKQKSFEKVTWRLRAGIAPDDSPSPAADSVIGMATTQVRMDGRSPEYVGGGLRFQYAGEGVSSYESSYWELHCEMQDGAGDGTVPKSSGAAPMEQGGAAVRQQFKLKGFGHEPSFKDATARMATLYAINKIAGTATRPK